VAALIQRVVQERAGGRVALVMIANPVKLNALSTAAILELAETMGVLAEDAQLRAVVITGAGDKAFSGGVNVGDLGATTPATAREGITRLHLCIAAVSCSIAAPERAFSFAGLAIMTSATRPPARSCSTVCISAPTGDDTLAWRLRRRAGCA